MERERERSINHLSYVESLWADSCSLQPVVATRNSRSRKRKSRDDRVEDGREEKDNNDDDAEIADVPPQVS